MKNTLRFPKSPAPIPLGDPCTTYQKNKGCSDYCKGSVDGNICYCTKPVNGPFDACPFPKKETINNENKVCLSYDSFNKLVKLSLKNCK